MSASTTPSTLDWRLFMTGGLANSCGQTVAHPIDVIKVRLQLDNELTSDSEAPRKYKGMFRGVRTLVLEEGFMAIWKGWKAAMVREMSFGGLRFMFYEPIKYQLGGIDKSDTSLLVKIPAGCAAGKLLGLIKCVAGKLLGCIKWAAGGISAAIVTPTDVVKTRLQAQVTGAPLRHSGCLAAFGDIYRSGGLKELYTGCGPNTLRATLGTCAQIASYDHTKHTLLNADLMAEGVSLHIVSSTIAGLVNAIVTTPVDLARIRIMNQPAAAEERRYRSILDVLIKTARTEGLMSLYKGFIPVWARIAPHTIVTFAVFEQLRRYTGIDPV
ncbi:mitochondrial substrate carrier family protein ucpB-like [Watersipora subatra]|uniref:mitochondrial substrate carrier family protein ucpB-like n=1 Tax=Watersipora subatra TaxID=2589382 RepID=UPI00355AD210